VPTILGELRRYFRDSGWSVHVPRAAQERAVAVEKAIRELSADAGPAPSVQLLAEHLEWSVDDVLEGLEARAGHHAASLDEPVDRMVGEGTTLLDSFSQVDEGFARVETRSAIAGAMRELPVLTRQIVALRYLEDLTQAEIGERVGVSQMQVSRVLRSALRQIHDALE